MSDPLGNRLSERAAVVLHRLWRLALEDRGFRLGGVRGWVTVRELSEDVLVSDEFATLFGRGFAIRENVAPPTALRPFYAWRISPKGALANERLKDLRHAEIPQPSPRGPEPVALLRQGPAAALSALRAASSARLVPVRFDVRGWATIGELRRVLRPAHAEAQRVPPTIAATDLRWLERFQMAERRSIREDGRERDVWRVTGYGNRVEPLDWR